MSKPTRLEFFVPGVPAPGGSKRAFVVQSKGGGKPRAVVTDDAKGNRDWKSKVADFAYRRMDGAPLLTDPIEVLVEFSVSRPKHHYGTGKNAKVLKKSAPRWPAKKPDATKLWRSTEDALTGVVWVDDAQVVMQHISKHWGENPGVYIEINILDN